VAGARPDTWMPLFIGDYLADTMHLTHIQHGIYMLLIMAYWRNGGPLADNAGQLAAIAKCSPQEWRKHCSVIARFFHIEDGYWLHKRIDAELDGATAKAQERRKSGTEGARRRWQNDGKAMAEPLANEWQTAWQNDAPSPSPSPSPLLAASLANLSQLPRACAREWADQAAANRAAAGLPAVDLADEWNKFNNKIGAEPTLERWLGWALKARAQQPGSGSTDPAAMPEPPWAARMRHWKSRRSWNPEFGPQPGEPGCFVPAKFLHAEAAE
jgi:uncharacterized protein YdaU (DUF1376 family)